MFTGILQAYYKRLGTKLASFKMTLCVLLCTIKLMLTTLQIPCVKCVKVIKHNCHDYDFRGLAPIW